MLNFTRSQQNFIKPTFMAAIFMAAVNIFPPFLAPYLTGKGFDAKEISFAFSIAPIAVIISSAILGKLSDHLGRKKVISLSIILVILSIFLFIFTKNSLIIIALANILFNIGSVSYDLSILQRIEDGITKRRGFFTGLFESLRGLGILLGHLIGTIAVIFFPIEYVFKIPLLFIFLIFILNYFSKSGNHTGFEVSDFNFLKNINEFLKNSKLRKMSLLGIAVHFSVPAQMIFIPLFITDDLKIGLSSVGIFASLVGFFNLFQFISGKMCDKNGDGKIIFFSSLIYASSFLFLCFSNNIITFYLSVSLMGLAGGFWNTSVWCYMSKIGEYGKNIGQVTGSYLSVAKIGNILSYLVSGFIAMHFGFRSLFFIYGAIIIMATMFFHSNFLAPKNLIKINE